MGFPKNFVWGVASSSYQVEGAWNRDGKGLSVWDTYVHEPGHIQNQDTGDTACDQYGHIKEDIALMAEMQIKAYRFFHQLAESYAGGNRKNQSKRSGLL